MKRITDCLQKMKAKLPAATAEALRAAVEARSTGKGKKRTISAAGEIAAVRDVLGQEQAWRTALDAAALSNSGGKEWVNFDEASGTLGIPREEMPQIKTAHRGALANFLKARGINWQNESVSPQSLKPTQREYSTEKVGKARKFANPTRAILVSKDNYVLDGHHQWVAALGDPTMEVVRLDADIKTLLKEVAEFPSAGMDGQVPVEATDKDSLTVAPVVKESLTTANGKEVPADAVAKLRAAFEGLGAPSPVTVEQEGLPVARMGQFIEAAQSLISAKITTPSELADVLEKTFGGAMRKYSQAFWNAFGMVNPSLTGTHDWNAIYAAAEKPAGNETATEANPTEAAAETNAAMEGTKRTQGTRDLTKIEQMTPAEFLEEEMKRRSVATLPSIQSILATSPRPSDRSLRSNWAQNLSQKFAAALSDRVDIPKDWIANYPLYESDVLALGYRKEGDKYVHYPSATRTVTPNIFKLPLRKYYETLSLAELKALREQGDKTSERGYVEDFRQREMDDLSERVKSSAMTQQVEAVKTAIAEQRPVSVELADAIEMPMDVSGYVKRGELYVYKNQSPSVAPISDAGTQETQGTESAPSDNPASPAPVADTGSGFTPKTVPFPRVLGTGINPRDVAREYGLPSDFYEFYQTSSGPSGQALGMNKVADKYRTPEYEAAELALENAMERKKKNGIPYRQGESAALDEALRLAMFGVVEKAKAMLVSNDTEPEPRTFTRKGFSPDGFGGDTPLFNDRRDLPLSQQPANVSANDNTSGTNLERPRGDAGVGDRGGEAVIQDDGRATSPAGNGVGTDGAGGGNTEPSIDSPAALPALLGGSLGDSVVSGPASRTEGRDTGNEQPSGSGDVDATRLEIDRRGESEPAIPLVVPGGVTNLAESRADGGEGSGTGNSSVADIRRSVPVLTEDQAGDVAFIEGRLAEHPGVLLTNGTGTGKTFSGMGAVKRMLDAGAKDILVMVPSDKIGNDWAATARKHFGISDVVQLPDIQSNGTGSRLVVTTYANAGQNSSLVNRPWAAIVADESHYLSSSKDGTDTNALRALRALTWHRSGINRRAQMMHPVEMARLEEIKAIPGNGKNQRLVNEKSDILLLLESTRRKLQQQADKMDAKQRPKAIMLSATPFAYHFSLDYAEGYLYDYPPENQRTVGGYGHASPRSEFYIQNFGYRIRYGKLTSPESAVAQGTMERMFSQRLMKSGAMRGRALEVDKDYGRQFVLTESALGTKIDEVMNVITSNDKYRPLSEFLGITDYLERRYLLEALKAREAVPRIREHLKMGRKVVVFHDYKKGGSRNPLRPTFGTGQTASVYTSGQGNVEVNLGGLYNELRSEVAGFDAIVKALDQLRSPISMLESELKGIRVFNGDVSKGDRRKAVDEFNKSGSGADVILVQRASGKEGISLHDTDGKHQRVFIDLGIPGRPTDAIQSEGRIYRHGVVSDAVIEYLTTGTGFERMTFAQTIAQRASTAENLAMGEKARSLLQAFATGYNNAESIAPNREQGRGGKAGDRAVATMSPFDQAVGLYFTNQKKTSRNKAAEGIDYFATPEPLGFKMVEWAGIRPGEKVLEPSAGHGAIARFFPDATNRHAIEPSRELSSRLALNAVDTEIHNTTFENYNIVNKFDAIVMNPPFGTAGRTAVDHLAKAVSHLREGGRIVAILPQGPAADAKFDKWYEEAEGVTLVASIGLPQVTFTRAGTSVSTRVVIIDKRADNLGGGSRYDIAADTIEELFAKLKDRTVKDRVPQAQVTPSAQNAREAAATLLTGGRDAVIPPTTTAAVPSISNPAKLAPADFIHTRDKYPVFVARVVEKVSKEAFDAMRNRAKQAGGSYSSFRGAGAIPGFHFKTVEARDAFMAAENTKGGGLGAPSPVVAAGPVFYSKLTQTVEALPQAVMTVGQARAAIEKGAKKDEVAMSGILTDPLSPMVGKQDGDKVTKAELVGYALERQATVQDVVLGEPVKEIPKGWTIKREIYSTGEDSGNWIAVNKKGEIHVRAKSEFDTRLRLLENLNHPALKDDQGAARQTHFAQYQLPGADEGSYREMFVTWPQEKNPKAVSQAHLESMPESELREWYENHSGLTASGLSKDRVLNRSVMIAANRGKWKDGHSQYGDITNPIVRIRRNIRTEADGARTYFIEEIQGPSDENQGKMPPELRKRIYEIGMKRALRDAVDEGADAIGWTTGEQQAERYSLEKQISEVNYEGKTSTLTAYDHNGEQVMGRTVNPEQLEDYIGKDAAQKLMEQTPEADGVRYLRGDGLKVGGEGLKRLYDVTLRSIANDLAKKFGGKVGTGEIVTEPARKSGLVALPGAGDTARPAVTATIHSMPIPDALRTQQRQQGNALFAPAPVDLAQIEAEAKATRAEPEDPTKGRSPLVDGSNLYADFLRGRLDRINHYAPGAANVLTDGTIAAAQKKAALRELLAGMNAEIDRHLGKKGEKRKEFTSELLPTAARLNAIGYDSSDNLVFGDFEMRAGSLNKKAAENAGVGTGDVWTGRDGETLRIGEYLEDQKAFQLHRSMPAARQEALYKHFMAKWPDTGHYLERWIDPSAKGNRTTNAQGVVMPDFNRNALRDFFGDVSPFGELGDVEGYVPEISRTRSLAGMIVAGVQNLLNKRWQSGAHEYKTGQARETGQVHDLFAGFGIRAMEAHAEVDRRDQAEKLLQIAVKDIPPGGAVPDGWIKVNPENLSAFTNAYASAHGMDGKTLTRFTQAVAAGDMETLKKLVGQAWALMKQNKMIRREVIGELIRPLADKTIRNVVVKFIDSISKSYIGGLLAHPFSWITNMGSNELFKLMRIAQRSLYGGILKAAGLVSKDMARDAVQRGADTALMEAWHLTKGLLYARRWNQAAIDKIVPPEMFEGQTGISGAVLSLTEEQMTAVDHLKRLNVPQAILQAVGYANMDVRAKQALAHASYMANAEIALRDAEKKGFTFATKAQRVAWMKNWLQNAGPEVHRRAHAVAVAYAMDYENIPRWMDERVASTEMNIIRRLMFPFIKWPYNMARQMKRFGLDPAQDVAAWLSAKTIGAAPGVRDTKLGEAMRAWQSGRKASGAKMANSVAHLATFSMMYAAMRALLGMAKDDDEVERLGRSFDQAGNRLGREFDTSNRINITDVPIIGPTVAALDKMHGDTGENDYWLRVRNIPYAGPMLAMASTMDWVTAAKDKSASRRDEAMNAWREFVSDFWSEGIVLSSMNAIHGNESKYTSGQPVTATLGGALVDLVGSRIAPVPVLAAVRDMVDPEMRRLNDSKSLEYDPGFVEGMQSRIPGLSKNLPPKGQVVTKNLATASRDLAKVTHPKASRVYVDEKGKAKASYVDPNDKREIPRWRTMARLFGVNIKPVDREGYKAAVTGGESAEEYRKMIKKLRQ